jgi:hypothetical protein
VEPAVASLESTHDTRTIAATFDGDVFDRSRLYGEGNPDLVWFCLPVLIYHPMQIAVGSALVPRLREFAEKDGDGDEVGSR